MTEFTYNSFGISFGEDAATVSTELIQLAKFDCGKVKLCANVSFDVKIETLERFAQEQFFPNIDNKPSGVYPQNYTKGYLQDSQTLEDWLTFNLQDTRHFLHTFCVENKSWVLNEVKEMFCEDMRIMAYQG